MKSVAYIIQVFLDTEYMFPSDVLDDKWVINRIKFFNLYTLQSILNQSFMDFRLLLICSERRRRLTQEYINHPKTELCYDLGRSVYGEIESDYVSITRIDSDDLFHKTAMEDVRDNQILTNKRECLIFRKCLRWDMISGYIGTHQRLTQPFYTHIFPRHMYKDWKIMLDRHFLVHGQAGGRLPTTKELPPFKVCVVKHNENHSMIKGEGAPKIRPAPDLEMLGKQDFILFDKHLIAKRLIEFGVRKENIFNKIERRTIKHVRMLRDL